MVWEAWVTAILVLTMLGVLATGRFGTDLVMLGVLALFLVLGIVQPAEAFSGFANTGVATVAFLYVIATGLQETGAMNIITGRLLGHPRSATEAQARMVAPVAVLSAFMNNTPLVAMFIPVLREWSRRTGISPSSLLMPLSFAAILGGACTLIGTSTNLVVFSLIEQHNSRNAAAPLPQMGMWTISMVGIPVALIGVAYMLVFGRALLPKARVNEAPPAPREFATAMRVIPDAPVAGRTVESAGLRHLPGLFLSRIERGGTAIAAPGPDQVLSGNDVLVFVGNLESVVDLQKINGLAPVVEDPAGPGHYRPIMKLIEAVVSHGSPLVGQSIREAAIRTRFEAVVVGVHRLGHRLEGKIGDITLRAGDTLLLEGPGQLTRRLRNSHDFYLTSELEGQASPRHDRAWVALGILVAVVGGLSVDSLPLIGKLPEVTVAMCGAIAMVLLRCCTGPQARAGVEWSVLVVIGASFGIGKAMENSGLAQTVAGAVTSAAGPLGPWGLIGAVYLLTLGFTTLISNNAAAALMFPIAIGVAQHGGHSAMPFAIAIALAASLEFMTPLGYQTNLMVMGPGGYKWADFLRFGGPLTALAAITSIALIPIVFPL